MVANILVDLAQRETQNRSITFAKSIVGEMGRADLHSKSLKSAGFRVLKSPDVPSVLLELGYLSHPDDEKRLTSDSWRATMADKVTAAIDGYFAKRIAQCQVSGGGCQCPGTDARPTAADGLIRL